MEFRHRRALEDRDAHLARAPRKAADQLRWLHCTRRGVERAAGIAVEAPARCDRRPVHLAERGALEPRQAIGDGQPCAEMLLAGGAPEPAVVLVLGVDSMRGAEGADLRDRFGGGACHAQRLLLAHEGGHGREARPQAQHVASVAPAGATAADVALDDRHAQRRLARHQVDRGPQPAEAAPDDRHVEAVAAGKHRRRWLFGRERLVKPKAAMAGCRFGNRTCEAHGDLYLVVQRLRLARNSRHRRAARHRSRNRLLHWRGRLRRLRCHPARPSALPGCARSPCRAGRASPRGRGS